MIETIEFGRIGPSYRKAKRVVQLTRQDVELGEFPDVDTIANPVDKKDTVKQAYRIAKNSAKYTGATEDGELIAYMTFNNWRVADQKDFASPEELEILNQRDEAENMVGQYAIFGMVIYNQLEKEKVILSPVLFLKKPLVKWRLVLQALLLQKPSLILCFMTTIRSPLWQ